MIEAGVILYRREARFRHIFARAKRTGHNDIRSQTLLSINWIRDVSTRLVTSEKNNF